MKKLMCLVICAVIFLNFTARYSFAGMDSIFHIVIANVEKLTGGNNRIVFNPIDYLSVSGKEQWAYLKYLAYKEDPTEDSA